MKIVGITACPSGVAHTYMAAEALKKAAIARGHEIKVETQGQIGLENGFQGGYAWFVAPNISIEPGLRYDVSADDGGDGIFSGNVGFAIHF